jgi:hypothetical protein
MFASTMQLMFSNRCEAYSTSGVITSAELSLRRQFGEWNESEELKCTVGREATTFSERINKWNLITP